MENIVYNTRIKYITKCPALRNLKIKDSSMEQKKAANI